MVARSEVKQKVDLYDAEPGDGGHIPQQNPETAEDEA
jgi:hypothetical protein